MPDEQLDTLGSLITDIKHASPAYGTFYYTVISDPLGYFDSSKYLASRPAWMVPPRIPIDEDLAAILAKLARKPAAGGPSVDTVTASLERAAETLKSTDLLPAFDVMSQLDWVSVWQVIDRLGARGPGLDGRTYLEILENAARGLPDVDTRMVGAMFVELMLRQGGREISADTLSLWVRLTDLLNVLDPLTQLEMLARLGVPPEAAEGAIAMMQGEAFDAGIDPLFNREPLVGAAATPAWLSRLGGLIEGIDPNRTDFLDWKKRPSQPNGFYIGNAVHKAIATEYEAAHAGHKIWANTVSVNNILTWLENKFRFQGALLPIALALARPDIVEFGFQHEMPPGWVYEIKPASQGAGAEVAAYEAEFYAAAMTLCGIPIEPGPSEPPVPGTAGVVPIPLGWAAFVSPLPGAIVYRIRWASKQALQQRKQAWPARQTAMQERVEAALRALGMAAEVVKMALMAAIMEVVVAAAAFVFALP